jgi:hypothetical protein
MNNPTQRMREEFRSAQAPLRWVYAARSLVDAATLVYHSAVDQKVRHDAAEQEAIRKASIIHDGKPTEVALVPIDSEEPRFLPAFLLYGYAVENLLKGLYVAKNPDAIGEDRLKVPAHHDLCELAKEAGYTATVSELELMKKLTTITTWSGRYPVAKKVPKHAEGGLVPEWIFDDPIKATTETQILIGKLRGLLDDGSPLLKAGAVAVWSNRED